MVSRGRALRGARRPGLLPSARFTSLRIAASCVLPPRLQPISNQSFRFTEREAARILRQILEAVKTSHGARVGGGSARGLIWQLNAPRSPFRRADEGVAHRDIK